MFDKISHWFFTAISMTVHIVILCLILSIPVYLLYQSNAAPVFTINEDVSVENADGDEFLASVGETDTGWYRISYSCTADTNKYCPYVFKVKDFRLQDANGIASGCKTYVSLSDPLSFTGGNPDDFTLSIYIQSDLQTAQALSRRARFSSVDATMGFAMFDYKFPAGSPVFCVG